MTNVEFPPSVLGKSKGAVPLKINTQKQMRIFKGVTLSLVLCAVVISVFAPFAFAATSTWFGCEVLATINVRRGPGLDYAIVTQYTAGTTFTADVETYIEADGYKWYQCPDGYIAQTGGLRFFELETSWDVISGYDAYGQCRWEHQCCGSTDMTDIDPNWGYVIDCQDSGYNVFCDCGWSKWCPISFELDPDTGGFKYIFIGLDTDGDERPDLFPGSKRRLKNRASSDLRPYQILEFLDNPDKDIPTVTLHFCNKSKSEVYASYTFYWDVDVHVEDYGIVMVGNDGIKKIHYVEGSFLLYDEAMGVHLADTVRTYEAMKQYNGTEQTILASRHMEFIFILAPPGEGAHGDFEHIIAGIRDIFNSLPNIFTDFGGLGDVFTDEDSPIYEVNNSGILDGVQEVFLMVRSFLSALPTPIIAVVGTFFLLACLIGVFKLFHG